MRFFKPIVCTLFIVNLFLAAYWLFHNNVLFHSDIARDFYLMKDIWDNKHLTLIGARAGGLSGWFHGPLWLYLNLPAFVLGHGNPVVVGWFWFLLHVFTCSLLYVVAKTIFNSKTALISLLVYSTITILDVHSYLNPQGALITFLIFFYFYWKYQQNQSLYNLTISLFLVGLLIQFQIAFGAPILVLTLIDNVIKSVKYKNPKIFLSYLILLLPLSTYFVFEIKHSFLQTKALLNNHGQSTTSLFYQFTSMPVWAYLSIILLFFKKRFSNVNLFLYLYLGFWVVTLLYPGKIMSYYYLPFLPVLIMVFVSLGTRITPIVFYTIIIFVLVTNWSKSVSDNLANYQYPETQDWTTWYSLSLAAKKMISDCGSGSGYFAYTADLYGYNLRYAVDYYDKSKGISINQKKHTTCLIIGPNVRENPYGSDNWKSGDINISGNPVNTFTYPNGITIEKYQLSPKEILIPPNPNLIKDSFFR